MFDNLVEIRKEPDKKVRYQKACLELNRLMAQSKDVYDSRNLSSGIVLLLAYLNDLPIDRFHMKPSGLIDKIHKEVLRQEFLLN